MKFAFVSLPVTGHLNPTLSLARAVADLGHEVVVFSVLDAQQRVLAKGLKFQAVGETPFPLGVTYEVEREMGQRTGEAALRYTFDLMSVITGAIIREVSDLLRAGSFDGCLIDTYQAYLELAPKAAGVPYIQLANAVHFDVSGATPLCFFPWPFEHTASAERRNLEGVEQFRSLLQPSLEAAKAFAAEHNLDNDWDDLTATRSKLAVLTQLPKEFDFDSPALQEQFVYSGPFLDEGKERDDSFPWDQLTGAPLVYASMGTLQNATPEVFAAIMSAAASLPHLQFVLSLGNKLDLSAFQPVPENVIALPRVPQREILRKAVLCITHAGLNTVLEALAEGIPMLALPVTNDQPGVAARIAYKQVGEVLDPQSATRDTLARQISSVLSNEQYKRNAGAISVAIRGGVRLRRAAESVIEIFTNA